MKSFYKIFIVVFALIALCSCEQKSLIQGGGDDNETDITFPSGSYIYFNVDPSTRAALIEGNLFKNFSVLGYNYQSRWSTTKVQASQSNSFTFEGDGQQKTVNMGVFYNGSETTGVQEIVYTPSTEGGIGSHNYTYSGDGSQDGYKLWDGNLRYSFFAWYPSSLKPNNENVNYEGNPYITYSLTGKTRATMEDVLTACKIDVTKYNGSSVNFTMKHRLAALDLLANSIITAKSLKEAKPDADYTGVADNAKVTVKNISNVTLKLTNLKSEVKIPLNTDDTEEVQVATGALKTEANNYFLCNDFACSDIVIPYYSTSEDMKTLMGDNKLILIPHTDDVVATLSLEYDVYVEGLDAPFHYVRGTETVLETTIKGLSEGFYHYLELTFTASGVYLQAKVEESWVDFPVYYEFE